MTRFRPTAILKRLATGEVDHVVVGGLAMTMHGSDRNTFDLDICPDQTSENLERLGSVLVDLDARLRGVDEDVPFVADGRTLARMQILTLDTSLGPLDVLARPDGSPPYRRLRERAEEVQFEGVTVLVAGIEDLLAMKESANREKDRIDVETLETILRLRKRARDR